VTEVRASFVVTGATGLAELGRGKLEPRPELLLDRRLGSRFSPATLALLRHKAQLLCSRVDRYPGRYLPRAAFIALAALIAYQGASLYGVIVTPLDGGPDRAVQSPYLQPESLLSSFDPFFTAAAGAAAPIAATDLTLHGFRQDRRTGGGSAIISRSDGAQRSFGTGEEVAPGIVLKQVRSDHVIIVRNGTEARLAFKAFESTGPSTAPTVREVRSPYGPTPAQSPAVQAPARRPAQRTSALPPRSVDFADPATLPASLTSGSALPDRGSTSRR
jgi:hypothetical protein